MFDCDDPAGRRLSGCFPLLVALSFCKEAGNKQGDAEPDERGERFQNGGEIRHDAPRVSRLAFVQEIQSEPRMKREPPILRNGNP